MYYSREQLHSMSDEQMSRVPMDQTAVYHEVRRDASRNKVLVRCLKCGRIPAEYGIPNGIPPPQPSGGVFPLRGVAITGWEDDDGNIHTTHRVVCRCGYNRPYRQVRLVAAIATGQRDLVLGVDL